MIDIPITGDFAPMTHEEILRALDESERTYMPPVFGVRGEA